VVKKQGNRMKLKTTQNVNVTVDEVASLLYKLIGKKTGKKVVSHTFDSSDGFQFMLEDEVTDLDDKKAE
jgi:hypothetical protein